MVSTRRTANYAVATNSVQESRQFLPNARHATRVPESTAYNPKSLTLFERLSQNLHSPRNASHMHILIALFDILHLTCKGEGRARQIYGPNFHSSRGRATNRRGEPTDAHAQVTS